MELNAEQRNRWHEYLSVELRNKADRKRHRHTKRRDLQLPVDEAKFERDIQGITRVFSPSRALNPSFGWQPSYLPPSIALVGMAHLRVD